MLTCCAVKEISGEEGSNRLAPSSIIVSLLKAVWMSPYEFSGDINEQHVEEQVENS
jgi:hypothetical protein